MEEGELEFAQVDLERAVSSQSGSEVTIFFCSSCAFLHRCFQIQDEAVVNALVKVRTSLKEKEDGEDENKVQSARDWFETAATEAKEAQAKEDARAAAKSGGWAYQIHQSHMLF